MKAQERFITTVLTQLTQVYLSFLTQVHSAVRHGRHSKQHAADAAVLPAGPGCTTGSGGKERPRLSGRFDLEEADVLEITNVWNGMEIS